MIEIYLKTNTNFEMNGNITLTPISCTYKASEHLVTLEHPIDDIGRWKYIDYENVISVEAGGKKKLYRIFNVVKSLYSITAYARPLFFDLIDNVLLDVRPTLKNGEEALNIILEGTGFTGHSNISIVNTSYYVRKNIVEAILGNDENSFLNRWGGEVLLDNFDIYINDKIGSDNGVRVEFGYNLNEIEEDINIEEVATRIIPTGYNGIMLDGSTPWVDSPLINKYTKPKMRVINFDDVKVKESETDEEGFNTIEEARAELIKRCNKLYEEGIDKPSVNYKIDMINLANTTAYKDYIKLVTVNEGDTVTCYIPGLDIDVKARVIDFVKDLITGEYISLELGNVQNNFFNNQADLQNRVNSILNSNGTVKADMLNGAINALDTKFKAQRDVAQPQQVRAMLFEDRVEGSPTFGCMCIGTMGFEIADSFKPGTKEWDFRTFGTGAGFVADCIVAGTLRAIVLESMDGSCRINLADGIVNIAKGIIKGLGMEINLDRGYISTSATIANETFEVRLSNGAIRSNHSLSLDSKDRMSIESTGNWLYFLCQQGEDSTKWSNILMTKDSVNITADGGGSGKVNINGSNGVEINGREITSILTNLEIQAMQSEGII
ncbi:MAG: phage tail spike protein [Clostridium sp.]|nr:phage tail spike protein [Clostridium sp.]